MPTELPSLRPIGHSSNLPNFISTVVLTNYLSNISEIIKSLRRCQPYRKRGIIRQLAITRNHLSSWWDSLPTEIHCRDLDPGGSFFHCNVHLAIYHATILIYIGRPFIFQESSGPHGPQSTSDGTAMLDDTSGIADTLRSDSLHAAFTVIELCQLLQDSIGLARVSYTEFNGCRAALLALIAHSIKNPTRRTSHVLTQGISLIRQMCVTLESARSEIAVIEALEQARQRLYNNLDLAKQPSSDVATGYDQFTEWAKLWRNDKMDDGGFFGPADFEIPFDERSHDSVPSFDGFLSSFPSELEEFSVIPGLNWELPAMDEWRKIPQSVESDWMMENTT